MRPCQELHAEPDMANCETCRRYYNDPKARAAMDRMGKTRGPCLHIDDAPTIRGADCCPRKWTHACEIFGACVRDDIDNAQRLASCAQCPWHVERDASLEDGERRPIPLILHNRFSPGDVVVMEAAIASLHAAHPGRYITDVSGCVSDIWQSHPLVRRVAEQGAVKIDMNYPAINHSDRRPIHFMQAYCEYLADYLSVPIPLAVAAPRLYLSLEEQQWMGQVHEALGKPVPYVVVNAGRKNDFTAKWWGTANFQALVNQWRGRLLFVQVGELAHHHPPLNDVLDLRGQTDTRQLMRLVYHSVAGVGPSTFLQHLHAALDRPYVLLAGGREPSTWQSYPRQVLLTTLGRLPCCQRSACWRSRTTPLRDDTEMDKNTCERPVVSGLDLVPQCLQMIGPDVVTSALQDILNLGSTN